METCEYRILPDRWQSGGRTLVTR